MHGYLKIRRNNPLVIRLSATLFLAAILAGCANIRKTGRDAGKETDFREFLEKYEKSFDPSAYDAEIDSILIEEKDRHDALEASSLFAIALPETIPGYRIQVLFTPEIEQANRTRDSLLILLPEEWTYVVYDAPYYKVRVGNFTERTNANYMIKKLIGMGFQDAWVVPDKIIKNPPPILPDIDIIPDRQPERR